MTRAAHPYRWNAFFRVAALLCLPGCALAADGMWKLAGNDAGFHASGRVATGESERWVHIEVHPNAGLVCSELERPGMRRFDTSVDARHSNGMKALTQGMTVLEGAALGVTTLARESACRKPDAECGPALSFYRWMIPFALDLAWGVYRSITIRNEVYLGFEVRGDERASAGLDELLERAPCATGTVVTLVDQDGSAQPFVMAQGGVLEPGALPALAAFLATSRELEAQVAGQAQVRIDARYRDELVARVRGEKGPGTGRVGAERPEPQPIGAAGRVIGRIEWTDLSLPVVHGITVDFPLSALCDSRYQWTCPAHLRCGNRGDGVPLCMGEGAAHVFCEHDTDCARGMRCARTEAGIGVCDAPAGEPPAGAGPPAPSAAAAP